MLVKAPVRVSFQDTPDSQREAIYDDIIDRALMNVNTIS